jgi:hypothetical protein
MRYNDLPPYFGEIPIESGGYRRVKGIGLSVHFRELS